MSLEYRIELSPLAQRQLKKYPEKLKHLIIKKLETLKLNPKPEGIKKLAGINNLYRLSVGDHRIIYT